MRDCRIFLNQERGGIMIERHIIIRGKSGLLNNQATFFVQKANEFESKIWIEYRNKKLNAKSLLGVLSMEIVEGSEITLIADGSDAETALDALEELTRHDVYY